MPFDPIADIERWWALRNQPQQPQVVANPLAMPSTLSPHRRRLSADEMPLSPGMPTSNRLSQHRRLGAGDVPASPTPMSAGGIPGMPLATYGQSQVPDDWAANPVRAEPMSGGSVPGPLDVGRMLTQPPVQSPMPIPAVQQTSASMAVPSTVTGQTDLPPTAAFNPLTVSNFAGGQRTDTTYPITNAGTRGLGVTGQPQAATGQGRVMPINGSEMIQRNGPLGVYSQDVSTPANVPHVDTAQFNEDKPRTIEQMLMSAANNRDYVSRGGVVSQAISPDERRSALGTLAELQAGRDRTGAEDRRSTAQNVSQERIARITADAATGTRNQISPNDWDTIIQRDAALLPTWNTNRQQALLDAATNATARGLRNPNSSPPTQPTSTDGGVAPGAGTVTPSDTSPRATPLDPFAVLRNAARNDVADAPDAAAVLENLVQNGHLDYNALRPGQWEAVEAELRKRFPHGGARTSFDTTSQGTWTEGLFNPLALWRGQEATPRQNALSAMRNMMMGQGRTMYGAIPGADASGLSQRYGDPQRR